MEHATAHRLAQEIRQSEEYQTYHALKEEMWKLQHVINTVSLERRKIVECASNISSLCASYHNEDVALLLKNFVVERLFSKGDSRRSVLRVSAVRTGLAGCVVCFSDTGTVVFEVSVADSRCGE